MSCWADTSRAQSVKDRTCSALDWCLVYSMSCTGGGCAEDIQAAVPSVEYSSSEAFDGNTMDKHPLVRL